MEKKCKFCYSNDHSCRNCPIELTASLTLKNKVGNEFEDYIEQYVKCPNCFEYKLKRLNNHSPSADLLCDCGLIIEAKSKCLSVKELPHDINLNHGSYIECIDKIDNYEINLLIIIYGVNRLRKTLYVREMLYADNNMLKNKSIIEFIPVDINNKTLTKIVIKDRCKLRKIDFMETVISFKLELDSYIKSKKLK
jgi:hypothetical protein